MPAKTIASDFRFAIGKKSTIYTGVLADQSMSDALPVSAIPQTR
jgi:hypothetical protein